MPTPKRPASKKEVRECKDILTRIDDLVPGIYADPIRKRLAAKGIDRNIRQIQEARIGRLKDLDIMRELEAFCREQYPEEFAQGAEIKTGLVK